MTEEIVNGNSKNIGKRFKKMCGSSFRKNRTFLMIPPKKVYVDRFLKTTNNLFLNFMQKGAKNKK